MLKTSFRKLRLIKQFLNELLNSKRTEQTIVISHQLIRSADLVTVSGFCIIA